LRPLGPGRRRRRALGWRYGHVNPGEQAARTGAVRA